jgi:hypothetical protein
MVKDRTLLEKLAALEHAQWIAWATTILDQENISEERASRWAKYFVPYEELDEATKEFDREWARKAIDIINERGQ